MRTHLRDVVRAQSEISKILEPRSLFKDAPKADHI